MRHPEPAEFAAEDGVMLRGQLWDRGPHTALLVHRPGGDLDRWTPLARALEAVDVSVLAFDLRGHGLSDGVWIANLLRHDIAVARRWLAERYRGLSILIGEDRAAGECSRIADDGSVSALVLLSPIEPHGAQGRESASPKLIVVGGQEVARLALARDHYDRFVGPRLLMDLPTAAQGADLLRGPGSSHLLESINAFLAVDLGLKRNARVRL